MKFSLNKEAIYKTVTLVMAFFVTLAGFIFLLAWHLGWTDLLDFPPSITRVPYVSSVVIFLSGLAMFALFIPARIPLANILGSLILLIALSRIVQIIFDLHLDQLSLSWLPFSDSDAMPMPAVVSIGFFFIGFIFAVHSPRNKYPLKNMLLLLTSLIIFIFGIIGLASYLVPLQLSLGWNGMPLNFYSQLCIFLIGFGLMTSSFYFYLHHDGRDIRLPLLVTFIMGIFVFLISWSLFFEKAHFIREILKSKLKEIKLGMQTNVQLNFSEFNQFSNFIDPSRKHLFENQEDILITGLKIFFDSTYNSLNNQYILVVSTNGKKLYSNDNNHLGNKKNWMQQDHFVIDNLDLTLQLYPSNTLLDTYINRKLIYISFFGSLVIAICIGMLTHLWQLSKEKIKEIDAYRKQLILAQDMQEEILKSTQMGTWTWDLKTDLVNWNDHTHLLFGIKPGQFLGTFENFLQRVEPAEKETFLTYLKECIDNLRPFDSSLRIIWPDESIHWLAVKGKFFLDEQKKPIKMAGFTWDISPVKRAELFLEVSESIAKIFSAHASLKKTFIEVIQTLHYHLEWSVMAVWLLDRQSETFHLAEITTIPQLKIPKFANTSRQLTFSIGITHPEHIWAIYHPIWIKDVTEDPHFSRFEEAKEEGLKGYLAFPVLDNSQVIGLIELFKKKPFVDEVDEKFLNLVTSIGIEVGQFIRRQAAEELQAQQAAIVTNAHNGIYNVTLDGIIKSWNTGAENIFGWKANEIIGKSITLTYLPNHQEDFEQIRLSVLTGHPVENFEMQALHKNGTILWLEKTIVAIKDQYGKPLSIASIVQDISNEKLMRDELAKNEKKFRDFVETIEEWFWEINIHCLFTYSNAIIEKILGYTAEEILKTNMLVLLPKNSQAEIENQIKNCISKKKGWSKRVLAWQHKDGSVRWLESNANPILDAENRVIGFRGADRDITERKLIEKSKNEFIAMVNHELRTPLTSILGALGLMRADKTLTEKLANLTDIAYRNSERLVSIVSDIIDVEKVELGKIEFELKPVSLVNIIDESIAASRSIAEKLGIHVVKEGTFTNTNVLADHRRLVQVMMNLLSNAFKFSPPNGTVYISMQFLEQFVRVSIRDQGKGIPNEFKNKIFERFAQADSSDSRLASGAGLGLNISRSLIEGMNGKIFFTSELNKGATFYFDLPLID